MISRRFLGPRESSRTCKKVEYFYLHINDGDPTSPLLTNKYVTELGKQLVKKGFGKYYTTGPGPRWGEPDRRNVEAFQRAQGWRGGAADGYPGPETWRRLFS